MAPDDRVRNLFVVRPRAVGAAALAIALATATFAAGPAPVIEVIFTEIPAHPTALVPGARDLDGDPVYAEFRTINFMGFHPDGSEWVITATNSLGPDLQAMLVRGAGTAGSVFAQEGQPVDGGSPGEVYNFFGLFGPSFNDFGQVAFIANARGGDAGRANKAMFHDGSTFTIVRQQGDPVTGMIDDPAENSGDETFGPTFGSIHVLNDGTIGFLDRNVQNIAGMRRQGVFYEGVALAQVGVTAIGDGTWVDFDGNHFWTTPDGSRWMLRGEDDSPINRDQILAVDGKVLHRQGTPLGGMTPWISETIFNARLHPCGDVFMRGSRDDPGDWASRNVELLAESGDPTGHGDELLTERFFGVHGNCHGDWIVAGSTDDPDPARDHVIIFNGPNVVVREGDMVDLDGDGLFNDDAFIGRGDPALIPFNPESFHLTNDGVLYFIARLRDGLGFDLAPGGADAFLRLRLLPCTGDVDGSGTVDVVDLLAVLVAWGPCEGCPEDTDGNGVVDVVDLLAVLVAWGAC